MPTVTKSKTKQTRQVAALASREPLEVPTAKRRARRRSDSTDTPPLPLETEKGSGNGTILPPFGKTLGSTPPRSGTQIENGAKGRMTMRTVALDLGMKKICYCEVSQGQVIDRATVSEVTSLKSLLGPEHAPARVAIEACRQAWFVHDLLIEWGNEVVVVDTTRSRQLGIGQHGRKTDRVDAETLVRALENGRIPMAHVLSPQRRELRRVLGVRRALVETRAHLVTTVRGLIREQGGRIPGCDTANVVNKARAQHLATDIAQLVEPLLALLQGIGEQLASIEERLAVLCAQEPVVSVLTTTPGVGTVIAAAFVSVVDEARRFQSAHQVESYVGLVPSEDTSGGKRRLGGITKEGNCYLRALLIQAAPQCQGSCRLS